MRRVYMDDRDEFVPELFNFVGVVHAEGLPLRFSRETLPQGKERPCEEVPGNVCRNCRGRRATESSANSLNIERDLESLRIPPF